MIRVDRFHWSESDIRRLVEEQQAQAGKSDRSKIVELKLPRPERGEKFVRGPIPMNWIRAAIPLGRKSINVVLAVWFLAGFKRESQVKLTAATLADFDVTSQAARAILRRFETAGLVVVDRKRGRSPIITILDVNKSNPSKMVREDRV
jgi:hypothetical protein